MTSLKIVPSPGDVEIPEDATAAVRRRIAEASTPAPPTEEELARRVMAEAHRLTNLSPNEWIIWVDRSAVDLGVPVKRNGRSNSLFRRIFFRRAGAVGACFA